MIIKPVYVLETYTGLLILTEELGLWFPKWHPARKDGSENNKEAPAFKYYA